MPSFFFRGGNNYGVHGDKENRARVRNRRDESLLGGLPQICRATCDASVHVAVISCGLLQPSEQRGRRRVHRIEGEGFFFKLRAKIDGNSSP